MRNIRLFIIALFGMASLWVGCSDSTRVTGTSEEENEVIAREESSSSSGPEAKSSSSKDGESKSSSSSGWNVSADSQDISSSSIEISSGSEEVPSSSSDKETSSISSSSIESSSSSVESSSSIESSSSEEQPPFFGSSSSERPGAVEGGTNNPNTIEYYISTFALNGVQFDSAVKASAIVDMEEPGLLQIKKEDIDTLKAMFPRAVKRFKDIVAAIENDSAECNLYLYNVQGSAQAAGHIMTGITPDSLTVLDVVSENCESTEGKMFGFLFTYCGEMSGDVKLVRTTVESNIPAGKCPDEQIREWIKEN